MLNHGSRRSPRGRAAFRLVRGRIVGLGGLEPPTSFLSAIEGSPLCGPAFPQVALDRQGPSNAFYVPAQPAHGQDAAAAGRVGDQLVAGKVMGLPGGRGSPIKRRDRGQAACPTRALRPARRAARTANPPARARAAARTPSEGMSQLGCPLGSAGGTGALVGWRQALLL